MTQRKEAVIEASRVIQNPFWEIVKNIPGSQYALAGERWMPYQYESRNKLASQYSWSIPSPDSLEWIIEKLDGRPVVEIGAGTGYWAYLLQQHGIDVVAYDAAPPGHKDNIYHREPGMEWTEVHEGGPEQVTQYADRVLLLSWPPYDNDFGVQVVANYANAGGDTIFYLGEGEGGCTGNDEMHALLRTAYREVDYCPDHVTWYGIHDELIHFTRRTDTKELT